MGRMYTAVFEEVAVTTAIDLFELVAPADMAVAIHGVMISQSSDAGDAESEQLQVLIHRGTGSGSGGTTPTPSPLVVSTTASTVVVECVNDTQGTEGAHIHAEAYNIMAGLTIWWPPEVRPIISPSGRLIVEQQTAPGDSVTMSGTIYFEEIGG